MHWRNCLMLETLHSTVIRSNALAKLFELLSEMTAPNVETIRCTDNVVWCSLSGGRTDELLICQKRCTQRKYDQMHWRICLMFCQRWLHSMLMSSDALTVLFVDVRRLYLMLILSNTLTIIWLRHKRFWFCRKNLLSLSLSLFTLLFRSLFW